MFYFYKVTYGKKNYILSTPKKGCAPKALKLISF